MILIPSLEIAAGHVVLPGTDASLDEVLAAELLPAARELRDAGADFFQVVDLDAERGGALQGEVIARLPDAGLPVQLAAAVRDVAALTRALELGVDRVAVAVELLGAPGAAELIGRFGVRLCGEARTPAELAAFAAAGLLRVVLRAPELADGPDGGVLRAALDARGDDVELFAEVAVRGRDDLQALAASASGGLAGVVLRSAYRKLACARA
ncbi:MAG: hypothetical protein IPM29_25635 [Planctomycetes bacterium]|nr:hypothetical protein [Planctomycetota bacterium]